MKLTVNDRDFQIHAGPETPLLYVLADGLKLNGTRFGCGVAQFGSCSVFLGGIE